MRTLLAIAALVLTLSSPAWSADLPLRATFLQLWDEHDAWPEAKWDALFADLEKLDVREIILQWTAFANAITLTKADVARLEERPAVARIADRACRAGMRLRFGLVHDPDWWNRIKSEPKLLAPYFKKLLVAQRRMADRITARYGGQACFAGFYEPQELDDKTWLDPGKRQLLAAYLGALRSSLTAGNASLAISGFSNGFAEPRRLAEQWTSLLRDTGLDAFYFQDGVGARKLTVDEARLYAQALSEEMRAAGKEYRNVVEVFAIRQPSQPEFTARPASFDRIARQIAAARETERKAPEAGSIAFSLPEYMTPLGGYEAETLFKEYLRAYQPQGAQ